MMKRFQGAPERFRDLRDLSVSDGPNSVHPIGRPIKNSNCSGVISRPPKASTNLRQLGHFCIDGATKFAFRVGVCTKPPTISLMVCPAISRRYTAEVRAIAVSFEVASRVGDCLFLDILGKDGDWLQFSNDAELLRPEVVGDPTTSRRGAEPLAGEAAADEIDRSAGKVRFGKASDIIVDRYLRPVFRQNAAAKIVLFAEGDMLNAGPMQPKG